MHANNASNNKQRKKKKRATKSRSMQDVQQRPTATYSAFQISYVALFCPGKGGKMAKQRARAAIANVMTAYALFSCMCMGAHQHKCACRCEFPENKPLLDIFCHSSSYQPLQNFFLPFLRPLATRFFAIRAKGVAAGGCDRNTQYICIYSALTQTHIDIQLTAYLLSLALLSHLSFPFLSFFSFAL